MLEHGSLDQRRIVYHGCERLVAIHVTTIYIRNFSPGQAVFVQECFPADAIRPPLQHLNVEAVIADVMERMFNAVVLEILACLPARVAALYSVNR